MSTTTVTTTETTVLVELNSVGVQGATGATGATGASGVVSVTSPITNTGTSGSAIVGVNQALLSLTKSQISDFTSGTVASAGTAQQSGTAVYSTTSGTAVYATLSGTAVSISGSITKSQVSDFASGTVTNISGTVAQSQVTSLVTDLANRAVLNAANTFTAGGQIVTSTSDTVMPLVLRRASATATASILEFQTSTSTAIASVDASGFGNFPRVSAGASTALGYAVLSANTGGTATIGLAVRGVASQSANLQEWQNSGGTAIASVASSGNMTAPFFISTSGIRAQGAFAASAVAATTLVTNATTGHLVLQSTATVPNTPTSAAGIVYVDSNGLKFRGTSNAAQQIVGADGSIKFIAPTAATVGAIFQAVASQTANLQEWQNSAGSALAIVASDGVMRATRFDTNNQKVLMGEEASGGFLTLGKSTGALSNPGANLGRIYFVAGTITGLKLVVRAGATGAETTILDNIPT
jgi:hypothetical protein